MFVYGVLFERFGRETKIDLMVDEQQLRKLFDQVDENDNVIGKGIQAFVIESGIRIEFETIDELIERAAEGKPIICDEEEWLFAIAGTREEARKAYMEARLDEMD